MTFFLAGADTTTLPLWILGAFRNAKSLPEVNAVATVILVISLPMIAARGLADARRGRRFARGAGGIGTSGRGASVAVPCA